MSHSQDTERPAGRISRRPAATGSEEHDGPGLASGSESDRRREIGGRKGPEPTRFGDWEKDGRCIDF